MLPFVAALALLSGVNQPVPYFALYPGPATAVNPLVELPDDKEFPAKGSFLLTTVSLGRTTAWELLLGWLDPDVDVRTEREILGDQTPEQFSQVQAEAIDNSKQVAVAVALRRLGLDVTISGSGALVENVVEGTPAAAALAPGDIVVSAAGQPVGTVEDLRAAVAGRDPGDEVMVEVVGPSGERRETSIALIACPEGFDCPGDGRTALGLLLRTKDEKFNWPFEVDIESQDIGGPSAGLAFALTVIDLLSPGELTGGRRIAVTGKIGIDGSVIPIGGAAQKAAAVRELGIEVFIVPERNAAEARTRAGDDLLVVGVADLESAIVALGRLGGDLAALGPAP